MDPQTIVASMLGIQNAFNVITALQLTYWLWPEQTKVNECPVEFDFIVVGAGSAGCVVAARLAAAKYHVLLIEAGGNPPFETLFPGLYIYLPRSYVDWNYTEDNPDQCTDRCHKNPLLLSRGKMIGGSGSMNGLVYVRGNPHDFKLWAEAAKDDSWNYDGVLEFFKKSELLEDPEVLNSKFAPFHGTKGPMKVTKQPHEEVEPYLEAFKELGYDILLDVNGNETMGYNQPMYNIGDGTRYSSAYAFIHPMKNYPYLHVLKNTLVTRVIFDNGNNAIGVEAILENNKTCIFKAKNDVILSAGVFNTPQILMLSGIGPKDHLKSIDIKVRSDLPVGENLQDHLGIVLTYSMDQSKSPKVSQQSPLEFPGYVVVGYAALNKSQPYSDYQTFTYRLPQDREGSLIFCSYLFDFRDDICTQLYEISKNKTLLYTVVIALHLKSRGSVLLRSKDPTEAPIVHLGMLSDKEDLDLAARIMEDFIRVGNTSYFKSVDGEIVDLDLPGCKNFTKGTIDYWKCYVSCMWVSEYHYGGTCSLGSVVDSRLQVFGVQGLRVADASVMPIVTSGNINAPTVMVGEKAAHFILEDVSCAGENLNTV